MHFKGRVDDWCKKNCNPYLVNNLEDVSTCKIINSVIHVLQVDTEICEQTFSWLSKYSKMTRYMNKSHYLFFVLYIRDLHIRRKYQHYQND